MAQQVDMIGVGVYNINPPKTSFCLRGFLPQRVFASKGSEGFCLKGLLPQKFLASSMVQQVDMIGEGVYNINHRKMRFCLGGFLPQRAFSSKGSGFKHGATS